jgi:hypothetical protein
MQGFAEINRLRCVRKLLHATFVPCFPRSGIFIGGAAHLTGLGAGAKTDARLTWLSVRCLSSCLFSASS